MSRSTSLTFRQAVNAQETPEVFLILVTIAHASLDPPIRPVRNNEDIPSNGETFIRCPFEITLPIDDADQPPRAKLRIDNVDRRIVQAIRAATSAPTVTIQIVLASDPDTLEAEFTDLTLREATYDVGVVTGDLVPDLFAAEPYPGDVFSPALFPGMF